MNILRVHRNQPIRQYRPLASIVEEHQKAPAAPQAARNRAIARSSILLFPEFPFDHLILWNVGVTPLARKGCICQGGHMFLDDLRRA